MMMSFSRSPLSLTHHTISRLSVPKMQVDPSSHAHAQADNYKLLTNLIVPRPIAWVTSLNKNGVINLAPFSFFNAIGANPLYLIISIGTNDAGEPKDTARNIQERGEFVVNLVTEELFEAMNISAADFPPDESELEAAHLHTAPSVKVSVPRVAEAQVSLECKLFRTDTLGDNRLVIGEIVMFHVADHLIDARFHVRGFAPIGRLGSPSVYCRTTDRFDVPRITYAQFEALQKPPK
jgi:flavin reductase (DIM6/NTAB) family NADH-FMN oxidoreductase RutF